MNWKSTDMKHFLVCLILFVATGCGSTTPKTVGSIQISATNITLLEGQSTQLQATVLDEDGSPMHMPVSWSSLDSTIVSITSDGLVRARLPGETEVRAQAGGRVAAVSVKVPVVGVFNLVTANGNPPPAYLGDRTCNGPYQETEKQTATLRSTKLTLDESGTFALSQSLELMCYFSGKPWIGSTNSGTQRGRFRVESGGALTFVFDDSGDGSISGARYQNGQISLTWIGYPLNYTMILRRN